MIGFWLSLEVLVRVGLDSSGRLMGSISNYPGTYKSPWSRIMAKSPSKEYEFDQQGN